MRNINLLQKFTEFIESPSWCDQHSIQINTNSKIEEQIGNNIRIVIFSEGLLKSLRLIYIHEFS